MLFALFTPSSGNKTFGAIRTDLKWQSFDVSRRSLDENAVTIGTVFHFAMECGWEFPKRKKSLSGLGATRIPKGLKL